MKFLINLLNPQQWKVVGAMLFGATGPVAWVLSRKLGMSDADVKMWLDLLAAITPVIGGALVTATQTDKSVAIAAGTIPGVQVHVDASTSSPAPPSVVDAAIDPSVKDVLPMVGHPRTDPGKTD